MAQAAGAEDVEDTEGAAVVEGEVAEVAEAVEEAVEEDVIRDNHRRVNHDLRSLALRCRPFLHYNNKLLYIRKLRLHTRARVFF